MTLEPAKNARSAVFAEEAFVVDVQSFLHRLMIEKGLNRTQLADAMGVSKARVSQIFSDECKNFTVRLLARACHALGEEPQISSGTCDALDHREKLKDQLETINGSKDVHKLPTWEIGDWVKTGANDSDHKASEEYSRKLVESVGAFSRDQAKAAVG